MKNKIELLAPAGNMESLIAAVKGGADAVYLGGTCFSARAFAGNFSHDELIEAIEYCHLRNVKVYVTMNTIIYEDEIDNAMKEVDFLYQNNVDAILVQDYGLFDRIRHEYPDLELHASTQMHTHNVNGCNFLKKEGFKRVVLARETPIEIIENCCKTGVEIEVFVYGAICISYSGQCLFSKVTQNRSGNRGMCAQCCRMKYRGLKDGKVVNDNDNEYLLSPKDLNVIDYVPQLIEAGVSSLKIEGRMKRKEYVYLVTKTFREAIDSYYEHKKYKISKQRQYELEVMFNRGFSLGHIFHDDVTHRMSGYRPNHMGVELGKVTKVMKDRIEILLFSDLHQNDGLRILSEKGDIGILASKIEQNGLLISYAEKGSKVILTYPRNVTPRVNELVVKTTDNDLIKRIEHEMYLTEKRVPIKIDYVAKIGEPLVLHAKDLFGNEAYSSSNINLEAAKKAPLTHDSLFDKLSKTGEFPFEIISCEGNLDNCFMPVSVINETRRCLFESLSDQILYSRKKLGRQHWNDVLEDKNISMPHQIIEDRAAKKEIENKKWIISDSTSTINEDDNQDYLLKNEIIRQNGSLYHELEHCVIGMTLNVTNSYGLAYFYKLKGVDGVIFSSEMTNEFIEKSLSAFSSRYGFILPTYRFTKGKRPLMTIKDNFTSFDIDAIQELHGTIYPVEKKSNYVEILENTEFESDNPFCYGDYVIIK